MQVFLGTDAVPELGTLCPFDCLLSPSGTSAAVAWERDQQCAVTLASAGENPGAWHISPSSSTPLARNGTHGKGWSASGTRFASLHKSAPGDERSLVGQVYDVRDGGRWHPESVLQPAAQASVYCSQAQFSACETWAAAAYLDRPRSRGRPDYFLAVCGAGQESACIVPLLGQYHAFAWLPRSPALVVRSCGSLAHVQLGQCTTPGASFLQPQWVPTDDTWLPQSDVALAVLPGGQACITMHCCNSSPYEQAVFSVALYSVPDLAPLSHQRLQVTAPHGELGCYLRPSVQASQRALAVIFEHVGTSVYPIKGCSKLAPPLFEVHGLQHPSFDASGRLLAGLLLLELMVVDAVTGSTLVRLHPTAWFREITEDSLHPLSAMWDAQHRPQLHVAAALAGPKLQHSGVLFMTLTFEAR